MSIEDDRARQRLHFLQQSGWPDGAQQALPCDASPRRYYRLEHAERGSRLLMDVRPPALDLPPYVRVAEHLNRLGLSAPEVQAWDAEAGLALIEDLGSWTYTRVLADGGDEAALYRGAVDTLVALHQHPEAPEIDCPPYDLGPLLNETALLAHWFAPACDAEADHSAFRPHWQALWQRALTEVAEVRDTLVLRDFHVDNLMWLPDRQAPRACGLLDFQDALLGSAAYDLVSLLQDARRDLAPGLEVEMCQHYLAQRPELDPEAFMRHYHTLGAQRHAKVAGIFVRLSRRDGKHQYLAHLPRVLRLLDRALQAADLGELRALLDTHLPAWRQVRVEAS